MEEAQELTVTNTGQPLVVEIDPADSYDLALELAATAPTNVTVEITPAE